MNRSWTFCAYSILLGVVACPVTGLAQGRPPHRAADPLEYHWNVVTDPDDLMRGAKKDWSAMVDLGALEINRSTVILYEHRLGHFNLSGF
jgi:hypothetical protein